MDMGSLASEHTGTIKNKLRTCAQNLECELGMSWSAVNGGQ